MYIRSIANLANDEDLAPKRRRRGQDGNIVN